VFYAYAMNILIVEDDRQTASFIQKGLMESGYVVDHAADGEDGLHLALQGVVTTH